MLSMHLLRNGPRPDPIQPEVAIDVATSACHRSHSVTPPENWRSCASHGMVGVAAGNLSAPGPGFAFQRNRKELGLLDHRCPASVLDNHWRGAYDQRRGIEL